MNKSNAQKIFNAKKLIEDLHSSDKRMTLSALTQLSTMKNVNVIPREIVDALCHLLKSAESTRIVLISTLVTLAHFSNFDRTKMMLGDAGIFPLIIPYLNSYTEAVKHKALEVLLGLCSNQKNQIRLVETLAKNVQTKEVDILDDPETRTQNNDSVEQPQVMLPLIGLLQREEGALQEKSITVLNALFNNRQCVEIIMQDDQVLEALTMLLEVDDIKRRRLVIELFEKLTRQFAELCHPLYEFNCFEYMLRILNRHDDGNNLNDLNLVYGVLKVLNSVIILKDSYRLWMGEEDGIPILINLLEYMLNPPEDTSSSGGKKSVYAEMQQKISQLQQQDNDNNADKQSDDTPLSTTTARAMEAASSVFKSETPEKELDAPIDQLIINETVKLLGIVTEEISGKDSGLLKENKETFLSNEGIKTLMRVLLKVSDNQFGENLRELCLQIIGNVSGQDSSVHSMDKPMIDILLEMLTDVKDILPTLSQIKTDTTIDNVEDTKIDHNTEKKAMNQNTKQVESSSKTRKDSIVTDTDNKVKEDQKKEKTNDENPSESEDLKTTLRVKHPYKIIQQKKSYVIKALSSFAKMEESVMKLEELGAISQLLTLVREKHVCTSIVCEIFGEMNAHQNFQKLLYEKYKEEGGIKLFSDLIDNGREEYNERIAALKALFPFSQSANGRLVLYNEGIIDKVQSMVDEYTRKAQQEVDAANERARKRAERKVARARKRARAEFEAKMARQGTRLRSQTQIVTKRDKEEMKLEEEELGDEEEDEEEERRDKEAAEKRDYAPPIIEEAKLLLRKTKKEHDATKKLKLTTSSPFSIDYNEISRIDKEMVAVTQQKIFKLFPSVKILLQVNWKFLDKLKDAKTIEESKRSQTDMLVEQSQKSSRASLPNVAKHSSASLSSPKTVNRNSESSGNSIESELESYEGLGGEVLETKEEALHLLSRDALWNELVMGLEFYSKCFDSNALHSLFTGVRQIIVEVRSNIGIEIDDLVMKYNIGFHGNIHWYSPKALAGKMSDILLGYDFTLFEEEEEIDEQYEMAVESLKKTCKDSRLALIGDVNILYFHLEMYSDELYQPTSINDHKAIIAAKSIMAKHELFIKGWKIVKVNKNGVLQERILILTNCSYYTVAVDLKNKKLDFNHCKCHPLSQFFVIDVGHLISRKDLKKKDEQLKLAYLQHLAQNTDTSDGSKRLSKSNMFEDGAFDSWKKANDTNPLENAGETDYGMNIVTREKAHESLLGSSSGGAYVNNVDDDEATDSSKKGDANTDSGDEEDLITETFKEETSIMSIANEEAIKNLDKKRPNTDGMYNSVFIAPTDVPKTKRKLFLEEIAWSIYSAASAHQRVQLHEPFEVPVVKPGAHGIIKGLIKTVKFVGSASKRSSIRLK